ncbi:hypothetical protein ACOY7G_07760 [Enterobacter bugandensis]
MKIAVEITSLLLPNSTSGLKSSVSLCAELKRWGLREGEYVFRSEETVLGLTRALIENVLIKYVEEDLFRHKPTEHFMTVFHFYWANDQRIQAGEPSWFNEFLDGIFLDVARRLRAGEKPPEKSILH